MSHISVLIQRWQDGDERAAESLYNEYREATFRLAYGLLGDPADAEEAAQDALAYALTHIARFNPERARFKTWLHTITVSRCRDRQRRRRLPSLSLTKWLQNGGDLPDTTARPEPRTIQTETHSEIWEAVQGLKPKYREAILLRYWAGHTYQDIADILGCPMRTVQSRVRLAYKDLRGTLAPTELINFQGEEVQ